MSSASLVTVVVLGACCLCAITEGVRIWPRTSVTDLPPSPSPASSSPAPALSRFMSLAQRFVTLTVNRSPGLKQFPRNIPSVLGYMATMTGMFPSMLQMLKNYQEKSGEALSLDTFFLRSSADIVNLTGSVLCQEPMFNVALNIYYIFDTAALVSQTLYYKFFYRSPKSAIAHPDGEKASSERLEISNLVIGTAIALAPVAWYILGRTGMNGGLDSTALLDQVGTICLWGSNGLFVYSRVPQIQKAILERNVEGIAVSSLLMTMLSNLLMGTGILLQNLQDGVSWSKMLIGSSAAIFLGTYGAIVLDSIFLSVYFVLMRQHKAMLMAVPDDEQADCAGPYTLLDGPESDDSIVRHTIKIEEIDEPFPCSSSSGTPFVEQLD